MSRYALRPYRHGDAAVIAAREDFRREHEAAGCPLFKGPISALGFTLERDGAPIACGGAADRGDGRFTLWGYAGELSLREWAHVAGGIGGVIGLLTEGGAIEALALVRQDNPAAHGFLNRLGFETRGLEPDLDGGLYRVMAYRLKEA